MMGRLFFYMEGLKNGEVENFQPFSLDELLPLGTFVLNFLSPQKNRVTRGCLSKSKLKVFFNDKGRKMIFETSLSELWKLSWIVQH